MSYKIKDRLRECSLFAELMPFGGKLNEKNEWIVLHDKMPWERLEEIYRKYHSHTGRPGKDSQLINGLLIVKHRKKVSDRAVVKKEFLQNPYIQYFCGYDQFVTDEKEIDPSTLSKVRGRLGVEYFRKFEEEVIKLLIEEKVIDAKELMVDATVYPGNIKYPTDSGTLEDVRKWLVKNIKDLVKMGGIKEKIRTYCRKARGVFVEFQRKRKKSKKEIRKATKKMMQYVRRNIGQVKELLGRVNPRDILDWCVIEGIKKKLKLVEQVYEQQWEMYRKKIRSIPGKIVSFHKPHIRPIVRGKAGKDTEFGPKCTLGLVKGFAFLDKISFEAYHEGVVLDESLEAHKKRFGKDPKVLIGDKIYGTRENRQMLKEKQIKASLVPLGRKTKLSKKQEQWVRKKQRERNEIEGAIGTSKTVYGLDRLRYKLPGGEEMNIRLGLISMNLSTMLARI